MQSQKPINQVVKYDCRQPNVQIEIFTVKLQARVKYVTLTNSERFKIEN